MDYLYHTYNNQIYMSLMNRYTPLDTLHKEQYPELSRGVGGKAYDRLTAKESCLPPFTREGV